MKPQHKRLGDLLVEAGLITDEQLQTAVAEQQRTGKLLGATLVQMGVISERELLEHLQHQLGLPLVDLAKISVDELAVQRVNEEVSRKYNALPIEIQGRSTLIVAMSDPLNVSALEDLRFHSGMFIKPVLAPSAEIQEAIGRFYHMDTSVNEVIQNIISKEEDDVSITAVVENEQAQAIDELIKEAEGRPIVRLTNWLMHTAILERASDIHIEPQDRDLVVRFRVDGLLHEFQKLPKWTNSAIVSRIKVLSNLDIAEKRQPQDGRLMIEVEKRRVDMRVSTLPVSNGEKVVIRIVDQNRTQVAITDLGMQEDDLVKVKRGLGRPQGIVLVTGPTGSGKTTLLYSGLRHIQHVTKNIVTVEDPVEFQITGINQVQVDEKAKKTFPNALRAILRQDPDVIMIGEIRDKETAQIAFRASVTGHLVLSTVHTNDAAGAVTRLVDLGLEPFMVASSLNTVVSMRLVRTLCPRCTEPYEANEEHVARIRGNHGGSGPLTLHRGRGCPHCHETGYHGRTGIFEVLEIDDVIRGLVVQGSPDSGIRQAAIDAGMRTIGEDGLSKVLAGITTLEEVTRNVYLTEVAGRVCGECDTVLNKEFEYCPTCGTFVGEHCEHCRRRMNPVWTFCPHCGENGARGGAEPQPRPKPRRERRATPRPTAGEIEPRRKAS
jgi:type IV pilus assembly protein PilB